MKNYDEITGRIKDLANNPDTLTAHISNNVTGITKTLPNVSQALGSHIVRSVGYLNSKIPKPATVMPLMTKWQPSTAQMEKFQRHYDIVNDPTLALHHIANGELSGEHMDALNSVHPELLQEMQHKIKTEIKPQDAVNLPNPVKKSLSLFLGQPLETSDLPAVKASNQLVYQQQAMKNQAQDQTAGKTTEGGLDKLNISNRSATSTQRLESKDD